ncbi:MAG: cobyric acid synthase [Bacteroidota bacterium]|nr:cobyric acid synthase [Bacteroidota bacterium]
MPEHKNIMVQGTCSSAGKSLLTAALCRIFKEDGYRVAPFKSQNMSLNSFITDEGLEMGRAQVVQAEACGIRPEACMNPVLLKPTSDHKAQVIVEGKVLDNKDAATYHKFKPQIKEVILKNYQQLASSFDVVVLEGAGSPAEINLRENDVVNMGMAEMADAPVILVADIDRGGVFASVVGTIFLLTEEERKRVKGVVINKFRGDVKLLEPGITMLEDIIKIPVLGVIPMLDVRIEDEDSVTEKMQNRQMAQAIDIAVIRLPHISNFTDFDVFNLFPDVNVRFVTSPDELGTPDMLIIPGSKNTIDDLHFLKSTRFDAAISELHQQGKIIVGICGGFQMLGKSVHDPYHIESELEKLDGLGLLDVSTTMEKEKTTTQITCKIVSDNGLLKGLSGEEISGYEIHMGVTTPASPIDNFVDVTGRSIALAHENVIGTYIHGFFDNTRFTGALLNNIREAKGMSLQQQFQDYKDFKESQYQKLAVEVRKSLDMEAVYKILNRCI